MWKSISSLARFTKKQVDSVKKAISQYAGQVINLVPEPIRRTVNTVTGNLITKINGIFENKKKLPPNAVEESSHQQEVVTNKTEIKSTPNETGESSTAQEVFTNKTEIKLVENGGRVKVYKTTGNLNLDLTDKIMEKITPIIETRTKVIHAFSCVIYRGQGEIIEYSKTFKAPPGNIFKSWWYKRIYSPMWTEAPGSRRRRDVVKSLFTSNRNLRLKRSLWR